MYPHEIKKDIYWVGAVDYDLRSFHRYSRCPNGSTYNAYLICDEKTVLIDSVSGSFTNILINNINDITPIEKIDYIICNHLEQDHSGALEKIVKIAKPEKIFCSQMGLKSMQGQFNTEGWNIQVVKDGETISIGKRNITFLETRMLHWPDSMVSYVVEDKLLFSNDIFGQNIASSYRFADECDHSFLEHAMEEYYNNIILSFSPLVIKALDRIASLNIEIDMIAPDHGLIYRNKEDINFVLEKYREMALQKPTLKALIVYDTIWKATKEMAFAIAQGLDSIDVPYIVMGLHDNHHSTVMTEIGTAGAVIMGSSTRNNTMLVDMTAMLAHMKGLKPLNKIGASFGSYGWSGEAPKHITEAMQAMDIEIVAEPLKVNYCLSKEDLNKCKEFGVIVGNALKAKIMD